MSPLTVTPENVAYGLRVNGITDNAFIRQRVEETLKGAALWFCGDAVYAVVVSTYP